MAAAGLEVHSVSGRVVSITDYEWALQAFNIEAAVDEAVTGGALTRSEADAWLASLRSANVTGGFLASVTNLMVVGRKPEVA
jgi:hypothetical protein